MFMVRKKKTAFRPSLDAEVDNLQTPMSLLVKYSH